jgi:hypothetical protein
MNPAAQSVTSQTVDRVVDMLSPLLGQDRSISADLRRLLLTNQFATMAELQAHLAGPGNTATDEQAQPHKSAALAILGDPNSVKQQQYWAQIALQRQRRDAQREVKDILAGWGRPPVQW